MTALISRLFHVWRDRLALVPIGHSPAIYFATCNMFATGTVAHSVFLWRFHQTKMSGEGYPFQQDALALARWDYCMSPDAVPELSDPLTCSLRARQCGSHIASTGDRAWIGAASGPLTELLEPAIVTGWAGGRRCLASASKGTCNLMTSERYGTDLWHAVGRTRAREAYAKASGMNVPPSPPESVMHPVPFGSRAWLIAHYG